MAWEKRNIKFLCGCEVEERVFITTEEELQKYKNICAKSICKKCCKEPVLNTDTRGVLTAESSKEDYDAKGK